LINFAVQAKDKELQTLSGQCKKLKENLKTVTAEKNKITGQYNDMAMKKKSMEANLNCQLSAALGTLGTASKSGKNLEQSGKALFGQNLIFSSWPNL
jgi:uncharacterized protein (DUF3084 family)